MRSNRIPLYYIVTILYWFSIYTYVPLLSPYVSVLHGTLFMSGIIVGSYGFTQMLLRIPLGIWSDRIGRRKPFLICGIAIGTLSSVGLALTSTVGSVLLFRALAGVAAASWVVFTVLYASYHDRASAPKAMGVISFYTSIGQMVATTAGGIIAQHFNWHAAFWLGASGGVLAFALSFFIVDRPPQANAAKVRPAELLKVGNDRILLGVSALAVLAQIITFSTMFGFTPVAAVHLGANKADLSLLTLLSTLPNAIASLYSGGLFSRKLGERNVILLGFVITAMFSCVIPFVHYLPLLHVTQAFNGFGQGLCMPVLMGLAIHHVAPERRATAMGFYQAIYSLGMFGGPAMFGFIGQAFNLQSSFLVVGAISLMAAIATLYLTPANKVRPISEAG